MKKLKLFLPALFIFSFTFSNFTQTQTKDFKNIIFTEGYSDTAQSMFFTNFLSDIKNTLKFNYAHVYSSGYDPSFVYGQFGVPIDSTQISTVNTMLSSVNSASLKLFLGRINIEKMCYSQRVVYEVQPSTSYAQSNVNYGFNYQEIMSGTYTTDGGRTVLHAVPGTNSAGYLCKNIYENLQHTDDFDFANWDQGDWFLKPTIKIPSGTPTGTPIIRIDIIRYDNTLLRSITINSEDFIGTLGNYIENFTSNLTFSGDRTNGLNKGRADGTWDPSQASNCHVDFKIYWYGNAEVWFDKLTVDDDQGNQLFEGNFNTSINAEVNNFTSSTAVKTFFADEVTPSNTLCIKKVQEIMESANSNAKLHCASTNYLNTRGMRNKTMGSKVQLENTSLGSFSNDIHVMSEVMPSSMQSSSPLYNDSVVMGRTWLWETDEKYNDNLQSRFGDRNSFMALDDEVGSFVYRVVQGRTQRDLYSPSTEYIVQPQLQGFIFNHYNGSGVLDYRSATREPMNSEIQAQVGMAIAHGAEGLAWYIYQSTKENPAKFTHPANGAEWWGTFGLINTHGEGYSHRTSNFYGEDKWTYMANLNQKIVNWKTTLDKISWDAGYSTHSEGTNNKYINDIKSIYRNPSSPFDYAPVNEDAAKYWEMGFFNPVDATDKAKYFIMVNRRCIPESSSGTGDYRQLKIKFNASNLPNFNNWKVTDVNTNAFVTTINKNSGAYYDLGEFLPGEAKLYKIVPVMQEGGTFVGDESVNGVSFTCNGIVNAAAHDLTLKGNIVISFADSAGINMLGGNFYCGVDSTPPLAPSTGLHLVNAGTKWQGIVIGANDEVIIKNTEIKEVNAVSTLNNGYSLLIENPTKVRISNCKFTNSATDSTGAGAINVQYISSISSATIDIFDNEINTGGNTYPPLGIYAYAGMTVSPYVRWNRITKTGSGGGIGIALLNLTGGTVRNNSVINHRYGMYIYNSTVNLWRDSVHTSVAGSRNLWAVGVSTLTMGRTSETYLGGENKLSNGTDSRCIHVEDSYFNTNLGHNYFRIANASERHWYGYLPVSDTGRVNALRNCFSIDGSDITDTSDIRKYVIWGNSTRIKYNFYPFNCGASDVTGYYVSEDDDIIDTVWHNGDISGLLENNGLSAGGENSIGENEDEYLKLYDKINLNIKKRQLSEGAGNCKTLLEEYPDGVQTLDVVGKLFYCVTAQNPNVTELNSLKSYYETFILNHSENVELVSQMYYYIQKTKVRLEQYESAMQGFMTIMNQFPMTYMGLQAKWDHMATQLLDSLNGTGGGEKETSVSELNAEEQHAQLVSMVEDPLDKYDRKKFTKEDRKVIVNNVVNSFETKKEAVTKKVKDLEERVTKNNATAEEKNALKTANKLKEIVKPQRVSTIIEHTDVMHNDVRKFLNLSPEKDSKKDILNTLPLEYKLNQNYPNPFNPSTKISYEIKHTGFVSLKIYDLLGREIAELVNETKEAGRYMIDFNSSKYSLASGIYFYRIKAGEFIDTKRMVLVK